MAQNPTQPHTHPVQRLEERKKEHTHIPVLECVPPSELEKALKAQPEPQAECRRKLF